MIFRSVFKILRAVLPVLENSCNSTRGLSYQHGFETYKGFGPFTNHLDAQNSQCGKFQNNTFNTVTNLLTRPLTTEALSNYPSYKPSLLTSAVQPVLNHSQKRTYVIPARNRAAIRKKYKCHEKKKAKQLAFRQTSKEECEECTNTPMSSTSCTKLVPPKRRYDPTTMKWKHAPCPKECENAPPRLDDNLKLIKHKKLPPITEPTECVQCRDVPMYGPPLVPLKKLYDPTKMKRSEKCGQPFCNIEPERMDDIRCWEPTTKILPTFC